MKTSGLFCVRASARAQALGVVEALRGENVENYAFCMVGRGCVGSPIVVLTIGRRIFGLATVENQCLLRRCRRSEKCYLNEGLRDD